MFRFFSPLPCILLILAAGCAAPIETGDEPYVRVSMDLPGFSAEEIDDGVASDFAELVGPEAGVAELVVVSRWGRFEAFASPSRGTSIVQLEQILRGSIHADWHPAQAAPPKIAATSQPPPPVGREYGTSVEVVPNRDRLAQLGLTPAELSQRLNRATQDQPDTVTVEELEMLVVAQENAEPVHLGDVAEVTESTVPMSIVRAYPGR